MIIGHRGGKPFGPDNTIKAFQGAIDHKIEGIEFDVWLSKDDIPMITHGGDNGQFDKYGLPQDFVYEWSCADLKAKLDMGDGEKMPTLPELLDLTAKTEMFMNIELKGPMDEEYMKKYDFVKASQIIIDLV